MKPFQDPQPTSVKVFMYILMGMLIIADIMIWPHVLGLAVRDFLSLSVGMAIAFILTLTGTIALALVLITAFTHTLLDR